MAIKIKSATLQCTCMQVERTPRRKCARTGGPTVVVTVVVVVVFVISRDLGFKI